MRRRVIAVAAALAALAALVVVIAVARGDRDDAPAASPGPGLDARTVTAGEVDVKIEPRQLDDQAAVFAVSFDTHSGDLSTDVARTANLEVGGVAWTDPAWDGDGPGGHHRTGELSFQAAGPANGEVRLSIDGLDAPVEATWRGP